MKKPEDKNKAADSIAEDTENGPKKITRRRFLGASAGVAAGVYTAGCLSEDYMGRPGEQGDLQLPADVEIVSAAIHPAIGVARVGNSKEEFFYGPEVEQPVSRPPGFYRDSKGAIKRQAARFRVYGYNAAGEVVRELTAAEADVSWTVHLANKKAAWYRFLAAMDMPEAKELKPPLRNADESRADMTLDPGPRTINGESVAGAQFRFDGASFKGKAVSLGELQTDESGRLVVLGGIGDSGSPQNTSIFSGGDTFANADGWYDDIADGPVSAQVSINGVDIPVDPAWVLVAPPNYAPDIVSWRTLYELIEETHIDSGMLPTPTTTSFTNDIYPIFQRMTGLQWVNKGFLDRFGPGTIFNFENASVIKRLSSANPSEKDQTFREQLVALFRTEATEEDDKKLWPYIYGDAFGSFPNSPKNGLALSPLREQHLARWLTGDFVDDWNPAVEPFRKIAHVPLAAQPAMLDKAALHFCVADAFHPGCEVTWPMRHATMYRAPFRIKVRPTTESEPEYGEFLTSDVALASNGPLHAQGPGDLTKWMAIPWQVDTVFCRSGYEPEFDPFLPTFWPARVPNHVLTEDDYDTVKASAGEAQIEAFANRESWVRSMKGDIPAQMHQMVEEFGTIGIVERRDGVKGSPILPRKMFVEQLHDSEKERFAGETRRSRRRRRRARGLEKTMSTQAGNQSSFNDEQAEMAGFEDAEQLRRIREMLGLD